MLVDSTEIAENAMIRKMPLIVAERCGFDDREML